MWCLAAFAVQHLKSFSRPPTLVAEQLGDDEGLVAEQLGDDEGLLAFRVTAGPMFEQKVGAPMSLVE